ncbi:N-acetylmuramoyl-L-alanine amidase [Streptomyces sp. BE20]|uniref:N-acetylmuramoyl-L-alanine amidase n=1 Tax=Streptomyces sp. BE20 TaxID=3002525 RepID=UPI002E79A847|nr:N-acetylmuramoyl-L-alanine amidase [Streptomyces sp. BE20]MEE1823023.1 N-acetylmuramoyl-L-alanine amidase [Streptomyces sp. BE20]
MTRTAHGPSGPTDPAPPTGPSDPAGPARPTGPAQPTGQTGPRRRSALLRTVTVIGVLGPLGLAGWLGWQAVGSPDRGTHASAPTAPATAAPAPAGAAPPAPDASGATPFAPATGAPATTPAVTDAPATAPATTGTPPAAPGAPTTPAAGAAPVSSTALAGRTVLLDPGHNSGNFSHTAEINRQVDIGNARKECDTTGTSTNAGYTEAEYSLDVVRRARAILAARGATVVLVHDGDRPWGPCIDERARAGTTAHADAAVSVHGDGGPASGSGFHVIMPAKVVAGRADTSAIVAPSHRLGLLLRDGFRAATGEPYADYTASQGLDTRSDLGGLNLSTVPKVFIECGNMRNPTDARRMTDPQWRQQAAQGIADALTTFLTTR